MTFACAVERVGPRWERKPRTSHWAGRSLWALGLCLLFLLAATSCSHLGHRPKPGRPPEDPPPSENSLLADRIDELLGSAEQRKQAREALIAAGSGAVPDLLKRIDDPEFTIRWEMVNILGYIGDPSAAPVVARQATHDENPHVRWRGYWSLSAMRGDAARDELRKWLEDGDKRVAWNATVGLTFFRDRSILPRLIAGLEQRDPWRRWEAANSIKSVADESAVPALSRLLSDPEVRLRNEAVLALAAVPGETATRALVRALDDPSPKVRWRVVM